MGKIPLPQMVADVEAVAPRRAIIFAKELNLSSIILEGDSETITRALQAEDQSLASYGNLIEEIRFYVDSFLSFGVFHIKGKENFVTHILTRHTIQKPHSNNKPHTQEIRYVKPNNK